MIQMSYKIRNTFLPTGNLEEKLFRTMHLKGEDLSNSPLVEWGRKTLANGGWWYGCEKKPLSERESCIQARQVKVLKLSEDIKRNGYNGSKISVFFNKEGNINTYDGFHRLCIMKYLGMEVDLNIVISYHDKNPERRGDFPLTKTIQKIHGGRKRLYQPVDDPRLKDFKVWRPDSSARLKYILDNLKGETVLDIGCSEGYFSRELAKRGYTVTAIDTSRNCLAVARYLSIINNLKLNHHLAKWQDYLKENQFDNILFLSVFHHDILRLGVEEAFASLQLFRGRAKRMFLEAPLKSSEVKWLPEAKKKMWDISEQSFKNKLEENTGMKVTDTWYGIRPLFLLKRD